MATSVPLNTGVTWVRYQVLAWLCVATTIAYMDRGCLQTVVQPIQKDLKLDERDLGLVISGFFIAYALVQMPAAWLGHAWGTRLALPFFAMVWSAAIGLSATAAGFLSLFFWRFVMGAAEAGIFPCAVASLARWFPEARRASVCGVLGSFQGVGGGVGTALTGLLLVELTWRGVFAVYALPGIAWSIWFFCWFRNRPADHPAVSPAELSLIEGKPEIGDQRSGVRDQRSEVGDQRSVVGDPKSVQSSDLRSPTPWLTILTSATMWWLNMQQFFRAAAYVFFMSWFPYFLQQTRGVSQERAGELASLPHFGIVLGSLAGGMVADAILVWTGSRRLSRQGLTVAGLTSCGVLMILAGAIDNAVLFVAVITVASFCGSLGGPSAYVMTIDLGGRHVATVFGLMNMSGNIGAILFPTAAPYLMEWGGSWDVVLVADAVLYLLGAVCWLFLDPHRPILK